MTDIVERMEEHAEWHVRNGDEYTGSMIRKAADEIERLREYMRNIMKVPRSDAAYGIIQCLARAALAKENSHD